MKCKSKVKIECNHWSNCGVASGGCCSISEQTGWAKPSWGTCLIACNHNTNKPSIKDTERMLNLKYYPEGKTLPAPRIKSKGLGDTVKKIINKVTGGRVKPCGGCKKRQEALNKLMTYKDKDTVN